ncbi:basic amino acid ABC transporter substrate-binding protein [Rubeoparvulum massiliense]|uniref:basic amino acid ABC transporter substrate-binding protein n=1 Tax=Rubeoparvulum massiliense TaxID=1631346 RepID=UPI00069F0D3D|nr:basic amino acid ABC transporter substrate-binding protein [Rubeoparvulum massiliense]
MKKINFVLALMIVVVIGLTGCGTDSSTPAPQGNDAAQGSETQDGKQVENVDKAYVVGTNAAFAPFEWVDDKGEVQGFDMDITKAIAEAVGIQVEFKNTAWDSIFVGLNNGESDLLASGVTITEQRKQSFDFTESYFVAEQFIVVPEGTSVKTLQDLKDKEIGVLITSTGDIVVSEAFGQDSKQIHRYDTVPLALMDLVNGEVDAVVADNAVVLHFLKNNPNYKLELIEDETMETEEYGLVVKKGDQELLDKLNQGLQIIKENGTYDTIYESYFGTAAK